MNSFFKKCDQIKNIIYFQIEGVNNNNNSILIIIIFKTQSSLSFLIGIIILCHLPILDFFREGFNFNFYNHMKYNTSKLKKLRLRHTIELSARLLSWIYLTYH